MPKYSAPAELRLEKFRVGVVMVNTKLFPAKILKNRPIRKMRSGRIAGMDHVEAVAAPNLQREPNSQNNAIGYSTK